ncbi:MAG: hypothetical protein ACYCV7_11540 [Acidimicrobiales bacterium]
MTSKIHIEYKDCDTLPFTFEYMYNMELLEQFYIDELTDDQLSEGRGTMFESGNITKVIHQDKIIVLRDEYAYFYIFIDYGMNYFALASSNNVDDLINMFVAYMEMVSTCENYERADEDDDVPFYFRVGGGITVIIDIGTFQRVVKLLQDYRDNMAIF